MLEPSPSAPPAQERKKRPAPGQRREQILQALALMLERPGAERITTAALARELGLSEAALYRHFASKAKMFEALIEFIEQSVSSMARQVLGPEVPDVITPNAQGAQQAGQITALLLQFAGRNPGLVRVMTGEALLLENPRLQVRINQFFAHFEATLRQCLRPAASALGSNSPTVEARIRAALLVDFARGRMQRFTQSGFRSLPTENLHESLTRML